MQVKLTDVISPAFYELHHQARSGEIGEALLKGGRGSGKSSMVSVEVILQLLEHPKCHAVCMRKIKGTLRTSVYAQMRWAISALELDTYFSCSVSPMQIVYKPTGQTIYFFGLDDPGKLKSIKVPFGYIGVLWFEELDQYDGEEEIRNVEQSVLRGGDWFFVFKSFNPPASPRNWANRYAREEKAGKAVHHSTYLTTPRKWLGDRFLEEAEHLKKINETAYRHEYLGEIGGLGDEVFSNIAAQEISEEQIRQFDRVMAGVDWGFYPDPWAFNRVYYDAARRDLYVFYEKTCYKTVNRDTVKLVKAAVGEKELVTADSAEPKSVEDYRQWGVFCRGAVKGPGSVEYSFRFLQGLRRIVIDPQRCPDTLQEFRAYRYERGRDEQVLPGYPDKNNHHIDAVRYATEPVWRRRGNL